MTDIVERLLVQSELGIMNCPEDHEYVTWGESAAEIKKLRAALEPFACKCEKEAGPQCLWGEHNNRCQNYKARAALEGK